MATPGQLQMYNKIEVSEMFGLDHRARDETDGKIKRIHLQEDPKVPDAMIFKIWLEDHTLGNILRMELLRNENVLFAGYKVPHPLDNMIELRVQTLPKSSPEQAVRHAVANLRVETKSMLDQFDEGVGQLRAAEERNAALTGGYQASAAAGTPPKGAAGMPSLTDSDHGYSPSDEHTQRFEEQLEDFHRSGAQQGSFSPSYLPTSPQHREGAEGAEGEIDGDEEMPPA
eukprot:TRINITY_DN111093_c0_g1_i1.p1 TRINITY_DN111093_c0_g1~~TRINITY_DN111093_c0_g1_i1.p1  ORF type:complete len:228 (+),score=58.58 TRINITY_DN111093_c0_g1_i1:87-770(+)